MTAYRSIAGYLSRKKGREQETPQVQAPKRPVLAAVVQIVPLIVFIGAVLAYFQLWLAFAGMHVEPLAVIAYADLVETAMPAFIASIPLIFFGLVGLARPFPLLNGRFFRVAVALSFAYIVVELAFFIIFALIQLLSQHDPTLELRRVAWIMNITSFAELLYFVFGRLLFVGACIALAILCLFIGTQTEAQRFGWKEWILLLVAIVGAYVNVAPRPAIILESNSYALENLGAGYANTKLWEWSVSRESGEGRNDCPGGVERAWISRKTSGYSCDGDVFIFPPAAFRLERFSAYQPVPLSQSSEMLPRHYDLNLIEEAFVRRRQPLLREVAALGEDRAAFDDELRLRPWGWTLPLDNGHWLACHRGAFLLVAPNWVAQTALRGEDSSETLVRVELNRKGMAKHSKLSEIMIFPRHDWPVEGLGTVTFSNVLLNFDLALLETLLLDDGPVDDMSAPSSDDDVDHEKAALRSKRLMSLHRGVELRARLDDSPRSRAINTAQGAMVEDIVCGLAIGLQPPARWDLTVTPAQAAAIVEMLYGPLRSDSAIFIPLRIPPSLSGTANEWMEVQDRDAIDRVFMRVSHHLAMTGYIGGLDLSDLATKTHGRGTDSLTP